MNPALRKTMIKMITQNENQKNAPKMIRLQPSIRETYIFKGVSEVHPRKNEIVETMLY
jgi:hypothetical protein